MGGVCALLTVLARCEWSVAPCRGELSLGYSRAKRPEPGASTGTKAHGFAKRKWSVAPRMPLHPGHGFTAASRGQAPRVPGGAR